MPLFLIILIGLATLLLLWRIARLSTGAIFLVGAALALGLVGYALQGSPALPAARAVPSAEAQARTQNAEADPSNALLGRFGGEADALKQADSYFRINRPDLAARVIKLGLSRNRNSPALWTGLGNALVAHGDGFLSPAAEFAYRRALRITPGFPGALYFYGVALAENGRVDEARPVLVELVRIIPADVPVRVQLVAELQRMVSPRRTCGRPRPPPNDLPGIGARASARLNRVQRSVHTMQNQTAVGRY